MACVMSCDMDAIGKERGCDLQIVQKGGTVTEDFKDFSCNSSSCETLQKTIHKHIILNHADNCSSFYFSKLLRPTLQENLQYTSLYCFRMHMPLLLPAMVVVEGVLKIL